MLCSPVMVVLKCITCFNRKVNCAFADQLAVLFFVICKSAAEDIKEEGKLFLTRILWFDFSQSTKSCELTCFQSFIRKRDASKKWRGKKLTFHWRRIKALREGRKKISQTSRICLGIKGIVSFGNKNETEHALSIFTAFNILLWENSYHAISMFLLLAKWDSLGL